MPQKRHKPEEVVTKLRQVDGWCRRAGRWPRRCARSGVRHEPATGSRAMPNLPVQAFISDIADKAVGTRKDHEACIAALIGGLSHMNGAAKRGGLRMALLRKSPDGRVAPIPGQTYPTASVTGMPSAVKPLRTATRTWNSAT